MRQKNPFSVSFGRLPAEYVTRQEQYDQIIETFTEEPVTDQIFIITGIRGMGKTVMFSSITNELEKLDDWIVIQLNTMEDMVESFYSDLYYSLKERGLKAEVKVSSPSFPYLPGIEVSVTSDAPSRTTRSKIEKLLREADRSGKKVLAALDEVSAGPQLKRFIKVFQEMIGKNLPVYFLGTAIYENIEQLRNEKDLTFLYRAPRISLDPLDLISVADKYRESLEVSYEESLSLSRLTKGYPFAFQALGYVYWDKLKNGKDIDIYKEYDRLLGERAYSKLWKEMSDIDRRVCYAIAMQKGDRVKDIREVIHMDSKKFNVYRLRLKEKGLIDTETYGKVSFTLPRFAEYVMIMKELE